MTRRLEVTWYDAAAVTQAWVPLADAISEDGRALVRIHSIGYVIHCDKKVLVLAGDAHDERVGRVQIIPRKSIVKRKRLRP